ncbi:uncharacterized protein LOC106073057 isoform X2 [Biomphalaria glabrata]|uniref:Uncharacterized protein LOC106073057 isoform X2 n=1 Tax=Biomphalaria glabrata TaxID=6526 RepID=A0A9W3AWC9_BIOGL|nr:uncharacterized protein LOC106073057 isoform X2 [Biomphalaria glabrata]
MELPRDNENFTLDSLLHELEFENKTLIKMIEKENQMIEALQAKIHITKSETNQLAQEIPQLEGKIQHLENQHKNIKDNIESQKKTKNLLADHELALTKQIEAMKKSNEDKCNFYKDQISNYTKIRDEFMAKYNSLSLVQQLNAEKLKLSEAQVKAKEIHDKKEEIQRQIQEKEEYLNSHKLENVIVEIAKTKLETLRILEEVSLLQAEKNISEQCSPTDRINFKDEKKKRNDEDDHESRMDIDTHDNIESNFSLNNLTLKGSADYHSQETPTQKSSNGSISSTDNNVDHDTTAINENSNLSLRETESHLTGSLTQLTTMTINVLTEAKKPSIGDPTPNTEATTLSTSAKPFLCVPSFTLPPLPKLSTPGIFSLPRFMMSSQQQSQVITNSMQDKSYNKSQLTSHLSLTPGRFFFDKAPSATVDQSVTQPENLQPKLLQAYASPTHWIEAGNKSQQLSKEQPVTNESQNFSGSLKSLIQKENVFRDEKKSTTFEFQIPSQGLNKNSLTNQTFHARDFQFQIPVSTRSDVKSVTDFQFQIPVSTRSDVKSVTDFQFQIPVSTRSDVKSVTDCQFQVPVSTRSDVKSVTDIQFQLPVSTRSDVKSVTDCQFQLPVSTRSDVKSVTDFQFKQLSTSLMEKEHSNRNIADFSFQKTSTSLNPNVLGNLTASKFQMPSTVTSSFESRAESDNAKSENMKRDLYPPRFSTPQRFSFIGKPPQKSENENSSDIRNTPMTVEIDTMNAQESTQSSIFQSTFSNYSNPTVTSEPAALNIQRKNVPPQLTIEPIKSVPIKSSSSSLFSTTEFPMKEMSNIAETARKEISPKKSNDCRTKLNFDLQTTTETEVDLPDFTLNFMTYKSSSPKSSNGSGLFGGIQTIFDNSDTEEDPPFFSSNSGLHETYGKLDWGNFEDVESPPNGPSLFD